MAIIGVVTNQGLAQSIDAANNTGWEIIPTSFGVSNIAGALDATRTIGDANPQFFNAAISGRNIISGNTIEFIMTIPPGESVVITEVAEIYMFAKNSANVDFLLAIGQPESELLYDPTLGSLTFRLQIQIANLNLASLFNFTFTQAAEISQHEQDPNFHPGGGIHFDTRDPLPTDDLLAGFPVFSQWVNTATNNIFWSSFSGDDAAIWVQGGVGTGTGLGSVSKIITNPSEMSIDQVFTGVDGGQLYNLIECFDFKPGVPGSVWGYVNIPAVWAGNDVSLKILGTLDGNDIGKDVTIAMQAWVADTGSVIDETTPDVSIINTIVSSAVNQGNLTEFDLGTIGSAEFNGASRILVFKVQRYPDDFPGFFKLTTTELDII